MYLLLHYIHIRMAYVPENNFFLNVYFLSSNISNIYLGDLVFSRILNYKQI